ncbi:syndecan-1 [Notothenia coriiceps]|uniref:Syndecan-1 n=1 Tax=Notothenia coriiceps TaxID=8208 RepID=A0A6I9NB56_9TELE|nr:PREDICTED: syndecan-1 [Notothenia coriiceps]
MRIYLKASWFLILGLIHPINMSFPGPPEDLEGSGYDLDNSGSGSGDWSEQSEIKNTNSKDIHMLAAGGGTQTNFDGTSDLNDNMGSEYVLVASSKIFLDNKEIFAAVIAGGLIGVVLAAAMAAILIYTWQKKDNEGYVLAQQTTSRGDYHRPNREEVIV